MSKVAKNAVRFTLVVVAVLAAGVLLGVLARRTHFRSWIRSLEFSALAPIDVHTHVFETSPDFVAMLERLHMHVLDIMYVDDTNRDLPSVAAQREGAAKFFASNEGRAWLCTTFNPFRLLDPNFSKEASAALNHDFSSGAVAVKIWKNIGMEVKDRAGNFVMPDAAVFEPIYKNIAAHNRTLIAHVGEPDAAWKQSALYGRYYAQNPQWDMSVKRDAPSKCSILQARDHLLAMNPDLRVVGAHLGSMEGDLDDLARHLEKYPNFAVDTAARVASFASQPRNKVRALILKFQERILYGSDLGFFASSAEKHETTHDLTESWRLHYLADWRYFATGDRFEYQGIWVTGLNLPRSVLKKLYHDNAVHWFPGIT